MEWTQDGRGIQTFRMALIRDTSVRKRETDPGNSEASRIGGVRHMGVESVSEGICAVIDR